MAEAVVSFVVERLGDLLTEEAKFLYGVKNQVMDLQTELRRMQCFLEDADAIREKDERIRNWIAEIRELAYRSEDVLETYIVLVASRRRRGSFRSFIRRLACILNKGITLHKVGSEIETIKIKIANLTARLQTYGVRDLTRVEGSSSMREKHLLLRRTYPHDNLEDFVGFEEVINTLVEVLVDKQGKHMHRAVSIYGIGGLGKTTLAKKVFNHKDVMDHFDAYAWACISQQWNKEDVLQRILISLMPEKREEIVKMRDEELVQQLFDIQRKKKCLVVLDDIWSTEVWDIIRSAFPKENTESKILLTSRFENVAKHIDPFGFHHKQQKLDPPEDWELFEKKAFPRGDETDSTIDQKKELGKKMVEQCDGLPLAIVVLGGLLASKHTLGEWQTVCKNIIPYLRGDKGHGEQSMGVLEVLALSFHDLPYWLKPCFLYLGNYPEDYEIETEKLYQLWIAEGFLCLEEEERGEEETMMEVAERYLGELAQRCMVQVQIEDERSMPSGGRRFKSCGLHDLMRDMCLSMIKEENFLTIINFRIRNEQQHCGSSSSSFLGASTRGNKIRRLAIYLDGDTNRCLPFDQEKNVRSVLVFCTRVEVNVFWEQMKSRLAKDCKLVRVLDLQGVTLSFFGPQGLPNEIGNLIRLRYLSLRDTTIGELPAYIGNLKYLETLDLRVSRSQYLVIPNVLWKLELLRHLYFPSRYYGAQNNKLRLDCLTDLQTLQNFNVDRCNVKDLFNFTKLRNLIVDSERMTQQDLMEIIRYLKSVTQKGLLLRCSSVYIEGLDFRSEEQALLRQLLLECHHLHKLHIGTGYISQLPEYRQDSYSTLTHLTLSGSRLEEDPMTMLEKLPNLIRLSLVDGAVVGRDMVCRAGGFPCLKYLTFMRLRNLQEWRVDEGAMPNLSTLAIVSCLQLKMVPDGLIFVTDLQELHIIAMPFIFLNRLCVLHGIEGEDVKKVRHVPSIKLLLESDIDIRSLIIMTDELAGFDPRRSEPVRS